MNLEKYEKETRMKKIAKAKTKKKKKVLTPQELEKKKAEQKAKRKTRQCHASTFAPHQSVIGQ